MEVIQAGCGLRVSEQYPGAVTGEMKVHTGDTGTAFIPGQAEGLLPDGFSRKTLHASDLTDFLGISLPFVSWRLLVTGILLLAGLAVFLVIRLASLLLPGRTKKGTLVWYLLALSCVAAVEAEGAYWMLADMPLIQSAWKAAAGAAVLAVFFLRRKQHGKTRIDLLLGTYLFVWNEPLPHILYTALLSIALMLLALGEKPQK